MTTASLTVIDSKNKKELNYWVWHDGYQLDGMLEDAKGKMKMEKFTMATLEELILKGVDREGRNNGFENWFRSEAGDWHWTFVILDENHAILTGAGNDDIRTAYWEI